MILVTNKPAKRDYELIKTYQAGVQLTGQEVKSLRQKRGSLRGSHVKIINGEAFLLNAQINPYQYADTREYEPTRTRKLLLTKREIKQLEQATTQKNTTLVPLSFETVGKHIKLSLAVGRGKKEYEKREDIKKRDLKRQLAKDFKSRQIDV